MTTIKAILPASCLARACDVLDAMDARVTVLSVLGGDMASAESRDRWKIRLETLAPDGIGAQVVSALRGVAPDATMLSVDIPDLPLDRSPVFAYNGRQNRRPNRKVRRSRAS